MFTPSPDWFADFEKKLARYYFLAVCEVLIRVLPIFGLFGIVLCLATAESDFPYDLLVAALVMAFVVGILYILDFFPPLSWFFDYTTNAPPEKLFCDRFFDDVFMARKAAYEKYQSEIRKQNTEERQEQIEKEEQNKKKRFEDMKRSALKDLGVDVGELSRRGRG